jgi:hypothetical protein
VAALHPLGDCHILGTLEPAEQLSEPSLSEVREELRSVLASSRFRNSPRLASLLRYICTTALVEEAEQITEYTIALDVLGKTENFKEGKDAIVRVEVHRLRKRLAEFYEDEGNSHQVRIAIPTGKYAPQFRIQDRKQLAVAVAGASPPAVNGHGAGHEPIGGSPDHAAHSNGCAATRELPRVPASSRSGWRKPAAVACLAILTGVLLLAFLASRPDEHPLDVFWNPVLSSASPILLCIGTESGGHTHPVTDGIGNGLMTLKEFHSAESQLVHVADASTLARFASLLERHGKRYRIASQSEATYADLQNSPVVLIGLLNNDWTKRLVGQLRFSVERPGPGKVLIRDRSHSERSDWFIDFYRPFLEISRDYALVLRATDPKTEQMVVAAGGMSVFGTLAAAEFLTNENEFSKLAKLVPRGWGRRNIEIVISTDVIRGHPGPPSIVASHFW